MSKRPPYHIAIVGATGAVGHEFLQVLERRNFPVGELTLLASKKSVDKKMTFQGRAYPVFELRHDSFKGVDFAFFSAGAARSREFAPSAVEAGAVVIDNSSAFRLDPKVPLVVPEVNAGEISKHRGIIANPNCTTIIMVIALYPIHKINPVKRVVVASYQAVSGAGARATAELRQQQKDILSGEKPQARVFKHVIADNLFSHDSAILDSGYNEEETKMILETRKILGTDSIQISPTCVRVPILRAHSEALHLELLHPVDLTQVRDALSNAPGVKMADDVRNNRFPMPSEATGRDDVLVGRIRKDPDRDNGVNLFVCGDQLLKGAALNAVQIAEMMILRA